MACHFRIARSAALALTLGATLASSGCSAFRAQFGGGIGLGVDVKLPGLLHTGLDAGQFMNVGLRYDSPELSHDASATLVAWHWEGRESRRPEQGKKLIGEHQCWAALPPLTTENAKDGNSIWDFEIGIMALVLDIRLGFNPLRWDNPDRRPAPKSAPPVVASPPREAPLDGAQPASAERGVAAPRPAPREPSPYQRDPLLPAVDPPADRGGD